MGELLPFLCEAEKVEFTPKPPSPPKGNQKRKKKKKSKKKQKKIDEKRQIKKRKYDILLFDGIWKNFKVFQIFPAQTDFFCVLIK